MSKNKDIELVKLSELRFNDCGIRGKYGYIYEAVKDLDNETAAVVKIPGKTDSRSFVMAVRQTLYLHYKGQGIKISIRSLDGNRIAIFKKKNKS